MAKYKVGDTVTSVAEKDTLYIITACHGYKKLQDGVHTEVFDYELIQILPVRNSINFCTRLEKDLVLYARYQSRMWILMVDFIKRDRKKNNWFEEPEFLAIVESTLGNAKATKQGWITYKDDNVTYVCESVDECLDALSDLNLLIEMFADDLNDNATLKEYIKQKKKVTQQLKKLTA
jgi:hypothetical protein